jgi:hypothetical protein
MQLTNAANRVASRSLAGAVNEDLRQTNPPIGRELRSSLRAALAEASHNVIVNCQRKQDPSDYPFSDLPNRMRWISSGFSGPCPELDR